MSEQEWRFQLTALVAEVKANQENLHRKLDVFVADADKRTTSLEHTVNGNGKPGIAEEVRSIKGRWGATLVVGTIVFTSVVNQVLAHAFK